MDFSKVAFSKFVLKLSVKIFLAFWLSISTVQADEVDTGYEAFKNKDYEKALTHLLPLAEQGYAKIQYMVYKSYFFLQKNDEATVWLARSADQGFEQAELEQSLILNSPKNGLSGTEYKILFCQNAEIRGFNACGESTAFNDVIDTYWDWFIY